VKNSFLGEEDLGWLLKDGEKLLLKSQVLSWPRAWVNETRKNGTPLDVIKLI
jgi:hypothetical protein